MSGERTMHERYVAAWAEMENPPLDSENPHFRNRFASLRATLAAIRPALARHGLAYRQSVVGEELVSTLSDGSGQSVELSRFPLHPVADPQKFGSQLTYAKRQQAQADWALVGEEDDDGEQAAKAAQQAGRAQRLEQRGRNYDALKAECERLAAKHGTTVADEWNWVCQTYGNPKAKTDEEYSQLMAILRSMEV